MDSYSRTTLYDKKSWGMQYHTTSSLWFHVRYYESTPPLENLAVKMTEKGIHTRAPGSSELHFHFDVVGRHSGEGVTLFCPF